ncbi:DUF2283 domain-containing protein [Methylobacterium sp. EM32]|uniref:DUF2283 domain-containing protein n=1 Tax=Methylobacterium sp. EM32 TaxID=3163481 RepID=UPI0033AC14C6
MKLRYDDEADALYVRFADAQIAGSEEIKPGLILDFDADGRLVALEILDASASLAAGADIRKLGSEAA